MRQLFKQIMLLTLMIQPAVKKFLEEGNKPTEPADVMLSIQQACNFLYMDERTLRRRKAAGLIACVQQGRTPTYSKKELERYRSENC